MGRLIDHIRHVIARSSRLLRSPLLRSLVASGLTALLISLALLGWSQVSALGGPQENLPDEAPFHPTFALLDADGVHVLESGNPVSTMQTCGSCHDAGFIADHSHHVDLGISALYDEPGEEGRPWELGSGTFGRWDPLLYRYLTPEEAEFVDLTTPEWLMIYGTRHVGGGPAMVSRDGTLLTDLTPDAANPETSIVDPETGQLVAWDWQESGVTEMNCFLCHMPSANNAARIEALQAGQFAWANTATLQDSGIVEAVDGDWQWNAEAFGPQGNLLAQFVNVQDPTDENCGNCHGLVHVDAQTPLVVGSCEPANYTTITTGQIISPQRLSNTGLNLEDKNSLGRSFDVHAERVVGCTDCHYSANNPIYFQEDEASQPDHLTFDPRRIDFSEYLERPLHQFAGGDAPGQALRACEDCHSLEATHNWLPYKEQHAEVLSCESCHVPLLYGPAREYTDWTVLTTDGNPAFACRGVDVEGETFVDALIRGYQPVLLPQESEDGGAELAPYNLVTTWYWVHGEPSQPIPLRYLQTVWLDGDNYATDVLATFDHDGDDLLSEAELVIDSVDKESLIAGKLATLGLSDPRIVGDVQPYAIHHNVTHGEWATRDCASCHSAESLLTTAMPLSDRMPGGVLPSVYPNDGAQFTGQVMADADGQLIYQPITATEDTDLYVLGHESVAWVDWFGILAFLGTLAGVTVHGGLRYWSARRSEPSEAHLQEVYMYTVYERLWHWLQTATIFILLGTGIVIHKPDMFGILSFSWMVQVHNIVAAILVINAALSAFYHFASGEIQQYLPRPRGFFDQAFQQVKFYVWGIFRNEPHPFEKSPTRKLNPLQQLTYLAILNVLLPLQVITGALMWGMQQWPSIANQLGGLPVLAPLHTLVAWLFASFIVMHVYLTTTGHRPLAGVQSMIFGWDELETHAATD
ncbi:MAG: hypothetical protein GYB68_03710 [Chloroflexi bacterium]|nr:hypothetical protein [Chloroflexota bacterium]